MLSQWPILAPALIAVVALGVDIWALPRPSSDTPPAPSAQQIADAGTAGDEASQVARLHDVEADSAKIVELCT